MIGQNVKDEVRKFYKSLLNDSKEVTTVTTLNLTVFLKKSSSHHYHLVRER